MIETGKKILKAAMVRLIHTMCFFIVFVSCSSVMLLAAAVVERVL